MSKREKQQALMRAEARSWRTPMPVSEVVAAIRAAAASVYRRRGKVLGPDTITEAHDGVLLGWRLQPSLVPIMTVTTLVERVGDLTTVEFQIVEARFTRQFPFPWAMTSRSEVRRFAAGIAAALDGEPV